MPLRLPQSDFPDVDAVALRGLVYTRARDGTRLSEASTAPSPHIGKPGALTQPPTYQATGNPYQGSPRPYGCEPHGPNGYQGFDASRQKITYIPPFYREWFPKHWEVQGEAGEEIVGVTKTGKGHGWVVYLCMLVAMGVLLGSLNYFILETCKSRDKRQALEMAKINEEGVTTVSYNLHHKVVTGIPFDRFTSTDKFEKRALPTILAQPDNHGKTTTTLRDGVIIVPYAPFPTYNSRQFLTKTVIATTSIFATVTEHTGQPISYNNCCPTITSYYPNYFHCPSPTLQPHLTLQCPYIPLKTLGSEDLKTTTTTSTMTLPCSAQPSNCRLPNGDFCIPETTYIPNPIACPTACSPLPTESVIVTHVVIAQPHGDYICVVDADTGELRDATSDERYDIAGGKGWYEWDRYVERPVKGVFRLLGELRRKGLKKARKMLGFGEKKGEVVHVVGEEGDGNFESLVWR